MLRGLTAGCLACSLGQSVATFCSNLSNAGVLGCPENGPACCQTISATCLACRANQSVREFCLDPKNIGIAGCINGRHECCKEKTARCFACEHNKTVMDYCSGPNQSRIPGCEFLSVDSNLMSNSSMASSGSAKSALVSTSATRNLRNGATERGVKALFGIVVAVVITVAVTTMIKWPNSHNAIRERDDGLLFAHDDME